MDFFSRNFGLLTVIVRYCCSLAAKNKKLIFFTTTGQFFTQFESSLLLTFANSGVMNTPIEQLTTDGYECQFGTNVIGHYLFTKCLHPLLCAAAQSSNGVARIVHSSSSALYFAKTLDLEAMKDPQALKKIGSAQMYMQSKMVNPISPLSLLIILPFFFQANLLISIEMARRYKDDGIMSVAVNPGNIRTGIQRHTSKLFTIVVRHLLS